MKSDQYLAIALAQCFWIGLNGTDIKDPETQRILSLFQPGGFILFKRNIKSISQVARFNSDLWKNCLIPPFLAVDQEGGTVERLNEIIGTIPPAMALTASGSVSLAKKLHSVHARILSLLGFNVNFNPVLDLAVGAPGNGLGTRCFSDDPKEITLFASNIIRAYQEQSILPCGKHFPGLGDTNLDSHLDLPVVTRAWKKILKVDLRPYENLLPQLPFIMVNHALYPEINSILPASLAPEIVRDLLLEAWEYDGLAISDDLMMGAVSRAWSLAGAAELAIRAGNHLFLICSPNGVVDTFNELLHRAENDFELARIIRNNASKIVNFKQQKLKKPQNRTSLSSAMREMERLSIMISNRAITKVFANKLPADADDWTLFEPKTKWIQKPGTALARWLRNQGKRVKECFYNIEITEEEAHQLVAQSKTEWNIIVVTGVSNRPGQKALIDTLVSGGKNVCLIHGSYPRDTIPANVHCAVASYWTAPAALSAAAAAIFSKQKAKGKWPFKHAITRGPALRKSGAKAGPLKIENF
jgi:beta-N-acetylhexosaminidase